MLKKIFLTSILILGLILIAGCQDKLPKEITLPDLTGMTKEQAINAISGLDLEFSFDDVIDNNLPEGTFIKYSNDFSAGDSVSPKTPITVYFSTSVDGVILPNLTGLNQEEVLDVLLDLDATLFIFFDIIETNDVSPGLFVKYSNNYQPGAIIDYGSQITVFLATLLVEYNSGLIISKYIEGLNNNKAIEIANLSNEPIDLSEYSVSLYLNGSEEISINIPLSGILLANELFTIVYNQSEQSLRDLADIETDQLIFDGNDAVAITKQGVVVDIIGNIGWELFILRNETFVRKSTITENSKTYNSTDWDIYAVNNYSMFGSHPVSFPTTFTFNPDQLLIPFEEPGGMVLVEYIYANDGDTSTFTPGFLGSDRVRFVGIDTPEMTPSPEPWAEEATLYLRSLLEEAIEIYIMHDPASGIKDTYNRSLGLVWADGVLTNYMMVLMGYSVASYSDENQSLIYNGVSLNRWFERAQQEAQINNRGIWSTTPR